MARREDLGFRICDLAFKFWGEHGGASRRAPTRLRVNQTEMQPDPELTTLAATRQKIDATTPSSCVCSMRRGHGIIGVGEEG
jgi:hypothetical protein